MYDPECVRASKADKRHDAVKDMGLPSHDDQAAGNLTLFIRIYMVIETIKQSILCK